uniref:Uncharacterized protein n=1 Tax=Ditylenchus dipsaci TaxID=166011 RepID=A0A915D259_9BILA
MSCSYCISTERGIVGSALWSVFSANSVLTKLYNSMPPQFSTRVSSVQSSKISEGSTAKAVNKLPCVEDLFAPDPFNEPTEDGYQLAPVKTGYPLMILSTLISCLKLWNLA